MEQQNLINFRTAAKLSDYSESYLRTTLKSYPHLWEKKAGKVRIKKDLFLKWVSERPKTGRKGGAL